MRSEKIDTRLPRGISTPQLYHTLRIVDSQRIIESAFFAPLSNSAFIQGNEVDLKAVADAQTQHSAPHFAPDKMVTTARGNRIINTLERTTFPEGKTLSQRVFEFGVCSQDRLPLYFESSIFNVGAVTLFYFDNRKLVRTFEVSRDELRAIGENTHPNVPEWWKNASREEINNLCERLPYSEYTSTSHYTKNKKLLAQLCCANINRQCSCDFLPDFIENVLCHVQAVGNKQVTRQEKLYLLHLIGNTNSDLTFWERVVALKILNTRMPLDARELPYYRTMVAGLLDITLKEFPGENINTKTRMIKLLYEVATQDSRLQVLINENIEQRLKRNIMVNGEFLMLAIMVELIQIPKTGSVNHYESAIESNLLLNAKNGIFSGLPAGERTITSIMLYFVDTLDAVECTDSHFVLSTIITRCWARHILTSTGLLKFTDATAIYCMQRAADILSGYETAQARVAFATAQLAGNMLGGSFDSLVYAGLAMSQANLIARYLFRDTSIQVRKDTTFEDTLLTTTATRAIEQLAVIITRDQGTIPYFQREITSKIRTIINNLVHNTRNYPNNYKIICDAMRKRIFVLKHNQLIAEEIYLLIDCCLKEVE